MAGTPPPEASDQRAAEEGEHGEDGVVLILGLRQGKRQPPGGSGFRLAASGVTVVISRRSSAAKEPLVTARAERQPPLPHTCAVIGHIPRNYRHVLPVAAAVAVDVGDRRADEGDRQRGHNSTVSRAGVTWRVLVLR
jgi:hypothetical protein